MTDCEKIVELLSAYYDGELSASDNELVRGHLETCESCTALLRLFGDVSGTLDDAEPPPELRERVMSSVLDAEPRRAANTQLYILRRMIPAAACLAVALLALSVLRNIGGSSNSASPQMSGALYNEAAMPGDGNTGGGGYVETTENFLAESAELEDGEAPDAVYPSTEPGVFGGGVVVDQNGEKTAAEPSTAPSATQVEIQASQSPQPQPPAYSPESANSNIAQAEDFSVYYAVIKLIGEAPAVLDGYDRVDIGDGALRIYIPADVAKDLIAGGCDYVLYSADADGAVVILVPSSD